MIDMTRTLRHTFTVQVEIDPGVWQINYWPDSVQDDSREHIETSMEMLINRWIEQTGNAGKVRHIAWERSGPGIPITEVRA